MRRTLALVVLVLGTACPLPSPAPPSPPDADAGPSGEPCAAARRHLVNIGCTPQDPATGTWIDVCRNARSQGLFALGCIQRAIDVEQAMACGVTCMRGGIL